MGGHIALHEGVAVSGRTRRILRGYDTAAAANVVNHHRLAQHFGPTLTQCSAHHVRTTAGSHWHDVTDGFAWIGSLGLAKS